MSGVGIVELFLLVNFIAIGVVGTIAVQHALRHFFPDRDKQTLDLTPDEREHLLWESQVRFQAVIEKSAQSLEQDLEGTSAELKRRLTNLGSGVDTASALLNKLLEKLGDELDETSRELKTQLEQLGTSMETSTKQLLSKLEKDGSQVIGDEMKNYREQMQQLHKQTLSTVGEFQQQLGSYQKDLQTQLQEEVQTQKRLLSQQIDTKLNNAVTAFLMETLQHNVDLGAQEEYLMGLLEEHKKDLKREVTGESSAAK